VTGIEPTTSGFVSVVAAWTTRPLVTLVTDTTDFVVRQRLTSINFLLYHDVRKLLFSRKFAFEDFLSIWNSGILMGKLKTANYTGDFFSALNLIIIRFKWRDNVWRSFLSLFKEKTMKRRSRSCSSPVQTTRVITRTFNKLKVIAKVPNKIREITQ